MLLVLLLSACSGQRILPVQIDLPVARGDKLAPCPNDGDADLALYSNCVRSASPNALATYEEALRRQKWEERLPGRWIARPNVAGVSTCLIITTLKNDDGESDGALLKFRVSGDLGSRSPCYLPPESR